MEWRRQRCGRGAPALLISTTAETFILVAVGSAIVADLMLTEVAPASMLRMAGTMTYQIIGTQNSAANEIIASMV